MLVEEIKSALAVDGVRPIEEFDLGLVGQTELHILTAGLGKFIGDPFIGPHAVVIHLKRAHATLHLEKGVLIEQEGAVR